MLSFFVLTGCGKAHDGGSDTATPSGSDGSGDTGGTGDTGDTDDTLDEILNPDNCTEAELGLLDYLNGLTPAEVLAEVAPRSIYGTVQYADRKQNDDGDLIPGFVNEDAFGATVNAYACDGSRIEPMNPTKDGAVYPDGSYELTVPANIDVTLRVVTSEFVSSEGCDVCSTWTMNVVDNTNNNQAYSYTGSVISAGQSAELADITIPAGDSDPFAIADVVFRTLWDLTYSTLWTANPDATTGDGKRGEGDEFGTITVAWSSSNQPVAGDVTLGEIGESYYDADSNTIYLLGAEDVNTDQFDDDVIRAQLVKHIMHTQARIDVGADLLIDSHGNEEELDPRLAFYDGFIMGFATGIAPFADSGQGFYKDSRGVGGAIGSIGYDVASGPSTEGWYISGSVANIVHNILADDELDILSYEVVDALTEASTSASFMTIFSFINALKRTIFDDPEVDDAIGYPEELIGSVGMLPTINGYVSDQSISSVNVNDDVITGVETEDLGLPDKYNVITFGGVPGGAYLAWDTDTNNLSGAFALDELNDASGILGANPVYQHFGMFGYDGTSLQQATVCSYNDFGVGNKLGNRRFVAFTIYDKDEFTETEGRTYANVNFYYQVAYESGATDKNIVHRLYKVGGEEAVLEEVNFHTSTTGQDIEFEPWLLPGAYILEFSIAGNLSSTSGETDATVCYDVSMADYRFF